MRNQHFSIPIFQWTIYSYLLWCSENMSKPSQINLIFYLKSVQNEKSEIDQVKFLVIETTTHCSSTFKDGESEIFLIKSFSNNFFSREKCFCKANASFLVEILPNHRHKDLVLKIVVHGSKKKPLKITLEFSGSFFDHYK